MIVRFRMRSAPLYRDIWRTSTKSTETWTGGARRAHRNAGPDVRNPTTGITPIRSNRAIPVTGELIDPRIADVEAMARWFDYAFVLPGGFRFGLAGIIGLVPGIGDL